MHDIEPFYNWRHLYISEEDSMSPFYGREHSDIYFTHTVYNYYIHPQWDDFGSNTLYLKIIFADYRSRTAIIEFIGEWNDLLYNDIMFLKRNVIEPMIESGISQFILIGENVLNFHYSDTDYYEEWLEELDEGWITCIGFLPHVVQDMRKGRISRYFTINDELNNLNWRTYLPDNLILKVESML
ncbi:MAG TPA: hypothetical protein PLA88_03815 [Bacteroidales bacterium]|nr:hypothetical protein [Bacteroidales bacterium]